MESKQVLVEALGVIKARGLATAELEDPDGRVCIYGALRVVLGYTNDAENHVEETDNFPFDNYYNADSYLKRAISQDFIKDEGFVNRHNILWIYSDASTEEEVIELFNRALDNLEGK